MRTSDRKMHLRIATVLLLTMTMIGLRLSIPIIFKSIITLLSSGQSFSENLIVIVLIGYGFCWVLDQSIMQIRTILTFKVIERYIRNMCLTMVDSLLSLSLRFHLERRTGALTSQIYLAQAGLSQVFWGGLSYFLPILVEMTIVMALFSYLYGWTYGIALFFIMASYSVIGVLGMKKSMKVQAIHNDKSAYASSRLVDSLLNFETVKYFNNEKYEHEQIDAALQEQEKAGGHRFLFDGYMHLAQVMVIGLGLIYITLLSGRAVYQNQISIGDFVLINGYLLQFTMPLNYLGSILQQTRKGLYDIHLVYKLIFQKPEINDSPNAISLVKDKVEVVFDNIEFGYTSDRLILNKISFSIPAGKTIAVVGSTGSGKSTLARLLYRFYDVSSGRVLINGKDIRDISQTSLQQLIGVVPQDVVLFNESIYYNIAYGNPSASKEEVEKAAALAKLDSLISSLPDGYHTLVGERGLKLSGGEKQRVSIARMILKKPSLFIFDEATSSLDTHTEKEIQKNLEEISSETTTLIIAHRLSTVVKADEILVLNEGIIVERGKHEQLLEKDGFYTSLWQGQQQQDIEMSLV
jgi:ATP-binding cassette subfamily B protein